MTVVEHRGIVTSGKETVYKLKKKLKTFLNNCGQHESLAVVSSDKVKYYKRLIIKKSSLTIHRCTCMKCGASLL